MGLKVENEEQAKELLKALSEFYQEPVKPVSRYCKALEDWVQKICELNEPPPLHKFNVRQGQTYHQHLKQIVLDIHKSSLLGRTIYGDETPRREMCPIHRGRWSGIGDCVHGCEQTGWVPNPEETTPEFLLWLEILKREERLNTMDLVPAVKELEDGGFPHELIKTYLVRRTYNEDVRRVPGTT